MSISSLHISQLFYFLFPIFFSHFLLGRVSQSDLTHQFVLQLYLFYYLHHLLYFLFQLFSFSQLIFILDSFYVFVLLCLMFILSICLLICLFKYVMPFGSNNFQESLVYYFSLEIIAPHILLFWLMKSYSPMGYSYNGCEERVQKPVATHTLDLSSQVECKE